MAALGGDGVAVPLRFAKLSASARAPSKGSADAAGFDLFAAESILVPPGGRASVKTDIQVAVPPGCYGRIAPRSGLALRHGIATLAGVVDADYRGNVIVLLQNHGGSEFQVSCGDRVAQLILEKFQVAQLEEVSSLAATARATGGFGSTGLV